MVTEITKTFKIALIVPCYNEQDNIINLFNEITQLPKNARYTLTPVFINDCSTDNTKQILEANNLIHINLPVNLGIGGAVQTGFMYALYNAFDVAIQIDGDGQHPPTELEKLILPIINNQADVVIGSRYITREGFQSSFTRRIGITYFKWLNKFLTHTTIHDSTSGFRGLNKKSLELVANYYPDEYPEPEAIVLYALNNLNIVEVPVIMKERQSGRSSINTFNSIYYMFKVTFGILFLYIRLKFNTKTS